MNMNFIAFSSQVKLLDRPQLNAAAAGHRPLDAGVCLLLGHCVHFVLDRIYQADGLHTPSAGRNGCGHQLVVQRGPKSTAAERLRAEVGRSCWGRMRLDSVSITELWRGVRPRAQRCPDK